ncbi:hypothetical protein RND71_015980 [Anisodus tanguticus]|uniref:Uncharacterized protein n=1 Tax=Anisodus tanguticus TaxID=243964 RepID=A0AAE1S832_9SOLA|nr:hypothetical protein RND71_015980 [Anisodus tanguticus]
MGSEGETSRSKRSRTSQEISPTSRRIEWYPDSAEERETTGCFLDFPDIDELPRLM